MHKLPRSPLLFGNTVAALALLCASPLVAAEPPAVAPAPSAIVAADHPQSGKIAPYRARFGRSRPVIAIIGENRGTELVDFVIPYGVLMQADVADVFTVATQPGVMKMRPALQLQPQTTTREFNLRFPDGADYVIVPAVVERDDPILLGWIAAQGRRGATIVSICDGALVVARTGLMSGHRATAHWATQAYRAQEFPDTQWLKNIRYVADGRIVSSAGISAAIPTTLALVEAIAGHARAAVVANELGVAEWGTQHDSDAFEPRFGVNLTALAATNYTNRWFHSIQSIGVPVAAGIDEIALAVTADAYSRTGRSHAYALAASGGPVSTRHGLVLVPDRVVGGPDPVDRVLPGFDAAPSAQAFDKVLAAIATRYGKSTAYGVALDFEYPGFHK